MNLRRIASLVVFISLFFLIFTSLVLFFVPQGRIAYWADWRWATLSKTEWTNLHINIGILFIIASLIHLFYNWSAILNYLKNKKKKFKIFNPNFNVAFFLTLLFLLGTYFALPPFKTIIEISEYFKDQAALKYGEPPYGHAELSPLKGFTKKLNLDLEESLRLLRQKGVKIRSEEETMAEIARKNSLSPEQVYGIIRGNKPKRAKRLKKDVH